MTKPETDDTKIALIAKDIQYMRGDIGEIKTKVNTLDGVFVTKESFATQLREINEKLTAIERSSMWWRWISPVLSGVFCTVITFLFIKYLENAK